MKRLLLILSLLFLFIACDQVEMDKESISQTAVMANRKMAAVEPMYDAAAGRLMNETSEEQKIIRTAKLRYEVEDMDVSLKAISSLLDEYKGVIESQRQYSQTDRLNTYLSVRVPAKDFEAFIESLLKGDDIRRLEEKNISARDVTEQFIDTEARLATKKEAMARYKVLLQKAETVTDMITVEDKIRRLQEEIESQEARLKYLRGQVDMSEVRIDIYEITKTTYVPDKSDGFLPTVLKALHGGLKGIVVVLLWIVRLWPLWLTIIIIRLVTKKKNQE